MLFQSVKVVVLLCGLACALTIRDIPMFTLPSCGNLTIANVNEGYIVSPNYPAQYPNNADVNITISASGLKTFLFLASSFDLEMVDNGPECYDKVSFVTYRYGISSAHGPFCGSSTASFPTLSLQGNQIQIRFTADGEVQQTGFKIYFTISDALSTPRPVSCGVPAIMPCLPKPSTNPRCPSSLTRIIGGTDALPNSYPWQAMMFKKVGIYESWCGASIIHRNWLLTSASCIDDLGVNGLLIRVGSHTLYEERIYLTVQNVYIHPSYVRRQIDYNVALLQLQETIQFNSTVSPICIDNSNSDYTGQSVVASGWGTTTNAESSLPTNLQEVELRVQSPSDCTSAFGSAVTPRILCATDVGKGICYGDVGGPLVRRDSTGRFYLIGVSNNWSASGCVTKGKPSLFTKVSAIAGWISLYVN